MQTKSAQPERPCMHLAASRIALPREEIKTASESVVAWTAQANKHCKDIRLRNEERPSGNLAICLPLAIWPSAWHSPAWTKMAYLACQRGSNVYSELSKCVVILWFYWLGFIDSESSSIHMVQETTNTSTAQQGPLRTFVFLGRAGWRVPVCNGSEEWSSSHDWVAPRMQPVLQFSSAGLSRYLWNPISLESFPHGSRAAHASLHKAECCAPVFRLALYLQWSPALFFQECSIFLPETYSAPAPVTEFTFMEKRERERRLAAAHADACFDCRSFHLEQIILGCGPMSFGEGWRFG